PREPDEIAGLARQMGKSVEEIHRAMASLDEINPMLGLRGCRLGIMYPEITAMQARAIFEAACTVAARKGRVQPEVMIPLVAHVVAFLQHAAIVLQVREDVFRLLQLTVALPLG